MTPTEGQTTTPSGADVLAVLKLVNAASAGPWEADDVKSDGEYGDGGPDSHTGFMAKQMFDAKGVAIFDSLNAEVSEVDESVDDEYGSVYAWDMIADKNFKAAAAAVNFIREHGSAVAALLTREAALVAEVDLLRRVQASMATEGVALVAERDALIDERDQLNSDYLTAINAANVIAAENKALREALIDVRDNVRDNSPVMWHRVDAALALGESRSDG